MCDVISVESNYGINQRLVGQKNSRVCGVGEQKPMTIKRTMVGPIPISEDP